MVCPGFFYSGGVYIVRLEKHGAGGWVTNGVNEERS